MCLCSVPALSFLHIILRCLPLTLEYHLYLYPHLSRQVQPLSIAIMLPTMYPLGAVGLQSKKTATQEISQRLNRFSISHYTVFSATPAANIVSYSFKLYRQEVQLTFEKFCSWITVVFSRFTYGDIYNWNLLFMMLVIVHINVQCQFMLTGIYMCVNLGYYSQCMHPCAQD